MAHIMKIDEFFNVFKKNKRVQKDNPLLKNFKYRVNDRYPQEAEEQHQRLERFLDFVKKEGWEVDTEISNDGRETPYFLYVYLTKPLKLFPQLGDFTLEVEITAEDESPLYCYVAYALGAFMDSDSEYKFLNSSKHIEPDDIDFKYDNLEMHARDWWKIKYKDKGISYEDVLNGHKEFADMVKDLIVKLKKQDI